MYLRALAQRSLTMSMDFEGLTPLIQVFDMPTSIRFYRDVLGFDIVTASGPVPDCDCP
jgi:glyoxylase I family protein